MTLSDEQRQELVRLKLENAEEALNDASTLLSVKSLRGACNRCYYAAFYATSALAIHDCKTFRKHRGLISYFHVEYIKTKRLPQELGRILQQAFENRSETDYQDVLRLTPQDITKSLKDAEYFISEIKKYLG